MYKISEVSQIAGVSVRTLHYYDEIGLLRPESESPAGYRLYSDRDLGRLHQILFFRELGFSLKQTAEIMSDPSFDAKQALKAHRELLQQKRLRMDALIRNVENAIKSIEGGYDMDKENMFKAFDMSEIEKHKGKYAEETRQKYGNTDAYKESQRKTSSYTREDWARISEDSERIHRAIAERMDKGPGDPEVQKYVAEWRQHITENYYNCTPEIFRGLADLYVGDERFTANIDRNGKGLAEFLSEAMRIYCDNLK